MIRLPLSAYDYASRADLSDARVAQFHAVDLLCARNSPDRLAAFREAHKAEWAWRLDLPARPVDDDLDVPSEPFVRPSKAPTRSCRECGAPLSPQTSRGRPSVRCETCSAKRDAVKQAVRETPNVCQSCKRKFPRTGKRGRQPTRCPKCQAKRMASA